MSITLFNDDHTRMTTAGGEEINPYDVFLSDANRSPLIALEDIIGSGNFGGQAKQGYAEIAISGDTSNVFLSGYIVNSHGSAFDLAFAPVPEPSTLALLLPIGLGLLVCVREYRPTVLPRFFRKKENFMNDKLITRTTKNSALTRGFVIPAVP
jgi:hypothetical protein